MAVGVKVSKVTTTLYIHKYEVWEEKGGYEEGGWWFTQGTPISRIATIPLDTPVEFDKYSDWRPDVEFAYSLCRALNNQEAERRNRDNKYGFHSVLSHRDTFYEYDLSDSAISDRYPVPRPHYE